MTDTRLPVEIADVNSDPDVAKSSAKRRSTRVASPLLEHDFANRFRLLDIVLATVSACWVATFIVVFILEDINLVQKVLLPGVLASLVGFPAYLLVRLGAVVRDLASPELREELAVTPLPAADFLRSRLFPHIKRCIWIPTLVVLALALLPVFQNTRTEKELLLAYGTVLFSVYFGIVAFLVGFISLKKFRATNTFFNIARGIVFLCCIGSPIALIIAIEEDYRGLHMLPAALMLFTAAWPIWKGQRSQDIDIPSPTESNERTPLLLQTIPVFFIMLALFWVIETFFGAYLPPKLHWAFAPQSQLESSLFLVILLALFCILFVSRGKQPRLKASFSVFDALLICFWATVMKSVGVYHIQYDPYRMHSDELWNAIFPTLYMLLHVLTLVAFAGVAAIAVGKAARAGHSIVPTMAAVVGTYLLAMVAAWLFYRYQLLLLLPMLLLHFALIMRNAAKRPLLFRYATWVIPIAAIALAPVALGWTPASHDDETLVFPVVASWLIIAVFAWKSAERNYYQIDH